jgi:hypothetical protein
VLAKLGLQPWLNKMAISAKPERRSFPQAKRQQIGLAQVVVKK